MTNHINDTKQRQITIQQ